MVCCVLGLGRRRVVTNAGGMTWQSEHGAQISRRSERRAKAFSLDPPRAPERLVGIVDGGVDLAAERLRAGRTPEGGAHVLQQVLRHFAAVLLGDERAIGLLARGGIADREIAEFPS